MLIYGSKNILWDDKCMGENETKIIESCYKLIKVASDFMTLKIHINVFLFCVIIDNNEL